MQENIFIQCLCCDRTSLVVSSHDHRKRRKMVSCIQYILSPPLLFSSLKKSMHTYCIGRVFSIGTNSGKGFAGVLHLVHLGQSSTFLLIIRSIPGQKYLCLADHRVLFLPGGPVFLRIPWRTTSRYTLGITNWFISLCHKFSPFYIKFHL